MYPFARTTTVVSRESFGENQIFSGSKVDCRSSARIRGHRLPERKDVTVKTSVSHRLVTVGSSRLA